MVAGATSKAGEESEEEEEDIQRLYCYTKPLLKDTGFSRIPCGVCPVSHALCLRVGEGSRERERERSRECQ